MTKRKTCSLCGSTKLPSEFYQRSDKPHLLQSHCKNCIKIKRKKHRELNIELFKEKDKKYHKKNRSERLDYLKKWQSENKSKRRENDRLKRKTDVSFAIRIRLHNRLRMAMKRNSKNSTTHEYLGCSIQDFILYFKSKFTNGMDWGRFLNGEIHIDHIIPCSSFDLSKTEDQMTCFNYSNLQPLWKKDNLLKSNKIKEVCHR